MICFLFPVVVSHFFLSLLAARRERGGPDRRTKTCHVFLSFLLCIDRKSWPVLTVFVCVNGTEGFLCVCSRQGAEGRT